jgi:type VI protein secretion system component VasF
MATSRPSHEQPQSPTVPMMLDALEKMLRSQLEEHQKLLALLERKREAVRQAKIDAIGQLIEDERRQIERIAEIDRAREQIVRRLTAQLEPDAAEPLALSAIADRIDEPVQSRLLGTAAQLRELVMKVRQTSTVVRSAAEALSNHISGVMQSFHAALSRAGVYGRQGHLAGGAQIEHSIDVKS